MKYIFIILLFVLCTSFNSVDDTKEFHIKVVGIEKVECFEIKYPYIINNREVYIAYLQRYYKGNEDEYINLIKR